MPSRLPSAPKTLPRMPMAAGTSTTRPGSRLRVLLIDAKVTPVTRSPPEEIRSATKPARTPAESARRSATKRAPTRRGKPGMSCYSAVPSWSSRAKASKGKRSGGRSGTSRTPQSTPPPGVGAPGDEDHNRTRPAKRTLLPPGADMTACTRCRSWRSASRSSSRRGPKTRRGGCSSTSCNRARSRSRPKTTNSSLASGKTSTKCT